MDFSEMREVRVSTMENNPLARRSAVLSATKVDIERRAYVGLEMTYHVIDEVALLEEGVWYQFAFSFTDVRYRATLTHRTASVGVGGGYRYLFHFHSKDLETYGLPWESKKPQLRRSAVMSTEECSRVAQYTMQDIRTSEQIAAQVEDLKQGTAAGRMSYDDIRPRGATMENDASWFFDKTNNPFRNNPKEKTVPNNEYNIAKLQQELENRRADLDDAVVETESSASLVVEANIDEIAQAVLEGASMPDALKELDAFKYRQDKQQIKTIDKLLRRLDLLDSGTYTDTDGTVASLLDL